MTKSLLPLGLLCVVFGLGYWAVSQENNATVEIAVLNEQNFDRMVPAGKEVDAIYGDIVLRNKYVTAVIAQPLATRNANMTVRDVAGCLIDYTTRSAPSDQLSCYYPGQREYPFREWTVSTKDGTSIMVGRELELSTGEGSVTVRSEGNTARPTVEVEYKLGAESRLLTVTTRYRHHSGAPLTFSMHDDLRADGGKEDMQKTPNGAVDEFWFEDHFWKQAYGFRAVGHKQQCNSDARRTAITYLTSAGQDAVTLKLGQTIELVHQIACGTNRIEVEAAFAQAAGQAVVPVAISVTDASGRPVPDASLEIRSAQDANLGRPRTDANGLVTLPLAAGSYVLSASANGQTIIDKQTLSVTEAPRQQVTLKAADYHPGQLKLTVVDAANSQGLPCKVQIIGKEGTATPSFGPESAEFGVRNVRYEPHGAVVQPLATGQYDLIISHGPEYGAVLTSVEIKPGATTELSTALIRQVDTKGWISSDFHSHASPSGDNTSSQLGRVLNLVCEHIEFAPCTEHNRITTYDPHIQSQNIGAFFSTTTGMELTGSPLPLDHQNAFPLHHHPHHQDGGGPQTDVDIEKQMQRLAAWDDGSEKLIQQNHPDVGWLFYDRDGDGKHDEGYTQSIALIDVMEIHPVETVLESSETDGVDADEAKSNRIFKWLQLQNQGLRVPGVVNTDAHYNFHGSGWLRNWIQCPTDDPAKIDPMDIVHASEEGRVIMSNGPYLQASLTSGGKTIVCGQDIDAPTGKVKLNMSVQCADWLDVDTVFVLVNGRPAKDRVFTRESHPDLFRTEWALRFQHELELTLESDASIVVATGGRNSTLGPVAGPDYAKNSPAALTNPFFVDVNGDGFHPNKDTLDRPLPVRGD